MATTVPMLAPDGTSGDIPQERMQDALKAGFKQAVVMTSPDGKQGYIPLERQQDAMNAGFKPVGPVQQPQGSTLEGTAPWQKAIDAAAQTTPYSADKGILGNAKAALNNLGAGAVGLLMEPVAHPLKTITGLMPDLPTPTEVRSATPVPWGKAGADLTAMIPGAVVAKVAAPVAADAAGAAGDAVASVVQKAKNYLRPPSSPSVVARSEMAARNLSAAVLPASKDASNFIQAAQQEVPNVIDYAKRTGNPLSTQLEFSKAAQGYAQDVRNFYEQDVRGPVQNKVVKTTGTGFGDRSGEGPDTYATIKQIDERIGDINQQLDKPAINSDDARRALASQKDLQREAAGLRDILHKNLAESSGLTPEQVADIRQRVGRSYELANDTNAAVTQRMQAAGKTDMGPVHMSQLPSRALEFARGGPVPIADRAFQRAIANFPGQAQSLPAVQPPAPAPPASLDTLLKSAREQRFNGLTSIENLLRIQAMEK